MVIVREGNGWFWISENAMSAVMSHMEVVCRRPSSSADSRSKSKQSRIASRAMAFDDGQVPLRTVASSNDQLYARFLDKVSTKSKQVFSCP